MRRDLLRAGTGEGTIGTSPCDVLLWEAWGAMRSVFHTARLWCSHDIHGVAVSAPRTKRVIGMWRLVVGGFLVLHGILHAATWIPRQQGSQLSNFGSQASWLFAEVRPVVVTLCVIAAGGFALAGVAYAVHLDVWAFSAM